jgi:glucokinase
VIEAIISLAEKTVAAGREQFGPESVAGVGLCVPGIIDEDRGVALIALNVEWHGDPLVDWVSRRIDLPIVLGHDARVAGLAEGLWGAAQGSNEYLFLALGTGVGAAVVIGGEPYFRGDGAGGELGHMSLNPDGPDCPCGRQGCLEMYASGKAIGRRYMQRTNAHQEVSGKEVVERARVGDRRATEVWEEAVDALSTAIVNAIALLSPDVVVIGGGVADAGDMLFGPLTESVANHIPSFHLKPPPPILPARFGKNAGLVGAAARAWLKSGVSRYELTGAWK